MPRECAGTLVDYEQTVRPYLLDADDAGGHHHTQGSYHHVVGLDQVP